MDVSIFLGLALIVLLLALLFFIWRYTDLKSTVDQRAREMFREWRDKELEDTANKKAQLLFDEWRKKYEGQIRKDAIEKSKAVITGKVTEHLIPYLPTFKYNPRDVRFIGSPVDLIVFDGLDEGEIRRIVFIEVKAGKSGLTKREKLIKDAIEQKKVEWELLRHEVPVS